MTRHPAVRRLYERLEAAGVLFAQLDRFERPAGSVAPKRLDVDGVELSVSTAAEGVPERLADEPLAPDDRVVRAERGDETIGVCVLSDRPVYVAELRRRLSFDGAYLWRLWVAPSERGRGVGTAIVARAIEVTAPDAGIVALVAPDNLPSRRAFRSLGFRPTERFTSAGYRGRRYHRRRPLGARSTTD